MKVKKSWHHLLYADVISFFGTRKCQKIRNIDENSQYWWRKSLYCLNDFRNFNEISGKMWLIIILKITKNQGFTLSLKDTSLEKLQGVKLTPHQPFKNYSSKNFHSCCLTETLYVCLQYWIFSSVVDGSKIYYYLFYA